MLFLHYRALNPALNTVLPTLTGSLINGQVLGGADGSWSTSYVEAQYRWLSASAPYAEYAAIGGAASSSYTLTGAEIGKRIIRSVRVRNGDDWSQWADSAPSAIVQDSPALPLEISGTPITATYTNSPYSFTVTALNGDPNPSPPKYTFALVGSWPTGTILTIDADGDQATISGAFAIAGTYAGLSVRVTDSSGNIDNLDTFALTVVAAGNIPKLTPGTGWPAATTGATNLGSPSAVGYGFAPRVAYADVPWIDVTGEQIIEILAFHSGPKTDWQAVNNPLFGIDRVEASVDNGPWATIPPQLDVSTNRWCYKVRIDANDWPDGTPTVSGSTSRRELRVKAIPKNGNATVLQAVVGEQWRYYTGFRFSTNAGGTLTTPIKYCSGTGNDTTGDGTSGNPYRTIGKAVTACGASGIVRLKNGEYTFGGVSAATAINWRWFTVEADTGAAPIITDSNASAGINRPMVRLRNLKFETTKQIGIPTYLDPNSSDPTKARPGALWLDNCSIDRNARTGWYSAPTSTNDWVRVCNVDTSTGEPVDTPPYRNLFGPIYVTGGSITNWPFATVGPRLIKNLAVGRISCDVWSSGLVILNSSVDTILAGRAQNPAGTNIGSDNFHPDFWQVYRTPRQPPITDYPYGGIMYNVTCNTGRANAQGPFFKDNTEIVGVVMINVHFVLDSSQTPPSRRNVFYLHSLEAMRNSLFYNVAIDGGVGLGTPGWSGPNEDVIAINLTFARILGGYTNVPSQMFNYSA